MAELDDVKKKGYKLTLNGRERTIRLGMKAWSLIQEKWGPFEKLAEALAANAPDTIVSLIEFGIIKDEGENVSRSVLIDWLDDYDIGELAIIAQGLMETIYSSLPNAKKGTRSSAAPQDAK